MLLEKTVAKYVRQHSNDAGWIGVGENETGLLKADDTNLVVSMKGAVVESVGYSRLAMLQKEATIGFKYSKPLLLQGVGVGAQDKLKKNRFQLTFATPKDASEVLALASSKGSKTRVVGQLEVKGGQLENSQVEEMEESQMVNSLANLPEERAAVVNESLFINSQLETSTPILVPTRAASPFKFLMRPTPVKKPSDGLNAVSVPISMPENVPSQQTPHSLSPSDQTPVNDQDMIQDSSNSIHSILNDANSLSLNSNATVSSNPLESEESANAYQREVPDARDQHATHTPQASFESMSPLEQRKAVSAILRGGEPNFQPLLRIVSEMLVERMLMD